MTFNSYFFTEFKIFKTLTLLLTAYLLTWTPFHICMDFYCFAPYLASDDLYNYSSLFPYFNSALNPFLYAVGNAEVRAKLMGAITGITALKCKR